MKRKPITDFGQLSPEQKAIWAQRSMDSARIERLLSGDASGLPKNIATEHIRRAKMLAELVESSARDIMCTSEDIKRLVTMIREELDKAVAAINVTAPLFTPPPVVEKRHASRKRK